jgi:hypothetical protein
MRRGLLALALPLLLLVDACTPAWGKRATLVASNLVVLCDLSQTTWMADGGKWDHMLHEGNPVLGEHPSEAAIVTASLSTIVVNTALYYLLPGDWGFYVNGSVLLVEGANVTTQPNAPGSDYKDQHHGCDVLRQM